MPVLPPEQSAADALLGDCDCHYCSAMRAHLEAGEEPDGPATYEERVAALEAEGLTTSDAQAAADAEAQEERAGEFEAMGAPAGDARIAVAAENPHDFIAYDDVEIRRTAGSPPGGLGAIGARDDLGPDP